MNFLKGKGQPIPVVKIKPIISTLTETLLRTKDESVIAEILTGFSLFNNDACSATLEVLFENQLLMQRFFQLMGHTNGRIASLAVRNLGLFLCPYESQFENALLEYGLLREFTSLIDSDQACVRKETCWALACLLANSP